MTQNDPKLWNDLILDLKLAAREYRRTMIRVGQVPTLRMHNFWSLITKRKKENTIEYKKKESFTLDHGKEKI